MLPVSVFMQNLKFGSIKVLAAQLFNKIKKLKKKHVLLYFPHVTYILGKCDLFLFVVDIDVTRNGNSLKLKVKLSFP